MKRIILMIFILSPNIAYAGIQLSFGVPDGKYEIPEFQTVREAEIFGKSAIGNEIVYQALRKKYFSMNGSKIIPKFRSMRQATVWGYLHAGDDDLIEEIRELWRNTRKKADNGDYDARQESDFYLEAIRTMEDDDLEAEERLVKDLQNNITIPEFESRDEAISFGVKYRGHNELVPLLNEKRREAEAIFKHGKVGMDRMDQTWYREKVRFYLTAIQEIQKPVDDDITEFALISRAWEVAQKEYNRVGADMYFGVVTLRNNGNFKNGLMYWWRNSL